MSMESLSVHVWGLCDCHIKVELNHVAVFKSHEGIIAYLEFLKALMPESTVIGQADYYITAWPFVLNYSFYGLCCC